MDPLPLTGHCVCKTGQGAGVWLNATNYFEVIYVERSLVGGSIVLAYSASVLLMPSLEMRRVRISMGCVKVFRRSSLSRCCNPMRYLCSSLFPLLNASLQIPESCSCQLREWLVGEKNVPRRKKKKCMFFPLSSLSFRLQGFFLKFAVHCSWRKKKKKGKKMRIFIWCCDLRRNAFKRNSNC